MTETQGYIIIFLIVLNIICNAFGGDKQIGWLGKVVDVLYEIKYEIRTKSL